MWTLCMKFSVWLIKPSNLKDMTAWEMQLGFYGHPKSLVKNIHI